MLKKFFAPLLLMVVLAVLPTVLLSAQDDPIEIIFIHIFDDDRQDVIRAIADAFEAENPGVTITLQAQTGYDNVYTTALQAADQGNAPHIIQVVEFLTQQAADSGYFIPVSDVASEDQLATLDDMLPTIVSYYEIGEDTWSVPWNTSNPLLYYNKDIFAAAGLDPENPPVTFADVTAACEAIMAADLSELEVELNGCINWPMSTWFMEQWMAMKDATIVNNGNGREARATEVTWTEDAMVDILSWWGDLASEGYYVYSGTIGDDNGEGISFLSKQTAMTIASTAGLTLIQNFSVVQGIDLGVARLPIPNEDATNGVTVGGASLWLLSDEFHSEEELQAANDFVFFLSQTENDVLWHQGTGYMPTRFSSIEQLTEQGWFEENPNFRIAVDQLSESNNTVANAGGLIGPADEVGAILISVFQSVVDAGADPAEALAVGAERANEVLADYNSFFED